MKSILLRLLLILLLAVPVYLYRDYFLDLEVLPGRQAMRVAGPASDDDPYLNSLTNKMRRLELNKIFWENRIGTKIPETYTLAISLFDSTIWMDLDGISIHESAIKTYQISHNLTSKIKLSSIKAWLGQSFHLKEEWASVPKEPIRTKDISKNNTNLDSLDFSLSFVDSTEVLVVLVYSNDLRIGLRQSELSSARQPVLIEQNMKKKSADSFNQSENAAKSYPELLQGDWISIELPSMDVLAIYRALQPESKLVIGL